MTTIRVEEYKRPTFDITFDKMTGSYSLGDKIDVKGTVATFSGVSLQDLPLNYTVTRFMRFGWQGAQLGAEPIASGTVSLNEDGQFTIPVSLSGDQGFVWDIMFSRFKRRLRMWRRDAGFHLQFRSRKSFNAIGSRDTESCLQGRFHQADF